MNRDTTNLVSGRGYGFFTWADLFTERQLTALTTLSDLVGEARSKALQDAKSVENGRHTHTHSLSLSLREGGVGPAAYADAVSVYLAFALSKMSDRGSTICTWFTERDSTRSTFARQSIPMTWDYAESNVLLDGTGSFRGAVEWTAESVGALTMPKGTVAGVAEQADAARQTMSADAVVSTDPPYYDNIGYADLSDYFFVWLRCSLRSIFPDLFATLAVPKVEELIATPYRHGDRSKAEAFFLAGMERAMRRIAELAHPSHPATIYYAFKQAETKQESGVSSTGWETFLAALIRSGFTVTGTWPMRTELSNRMVGMGANALASSIVLVCRRRPADAAVAGRTAFIDALKEELPPALVELQKAGIAPVDLAQAAIGPGMAVFSRYRSVNHVDGKPLTVREALAHLNEVLDQTLEEQEGDFDGDTRWAVAWFTQYHFEEGEFGDAETLSKAKNTSVAGLVEAGILVSGGGRVRLLRPEELPEDGSAAHGLGGRPPPDPRARHGRGDGGGAAAAEGARERRGGAAAGAPALRCLRAAAAPGGSPRLQRSRRLLVGDRLPRPGGAREDPGALLTGKGAGRSRPVPARGIGSGRGRFRLRHRLGSTPRGEQFDTRRHSPDPVSVTRRRPRPPPAPPPGSAAPGGNDQKRKRSWPMICRFSTSPKMCCWMSWFSRLTTRTPGRSRPSSRSTDRLVFTMVKGSVQPW